MDAQASSRRRCSPRLGRLTSLSRGSGELKKQSYSMKKNNSGIPIRAVMPDMAGPNFVRWKIKGSACPPSWEEALKR